MEQKSNCVEIFLLGFRSLLPYTSNFTDKQLEKRIGKEKLLEVAEDVEGFILAGSNTKLSKNEKIAMTCQAMKCLHKHIVQVGAPVTMKTVLENIHLIGYAVDKAFPGYASSQLLKYTITPASIPARIMQIETANP